jgi:hypothetical protein
MAVGIGIGVSVPCGTALSEATPQARARLQGHWQAQARQGSGHFKWLNGQVGSMGGEGSVGSIWHEYLVEFQKSGTRVSESVEHQGFYFHLVEFPRDD